MKARFHKAAKRELDEEIAYYEQQLPGFGQRYYEAAKAALERIKRFPEAYSSLSNRTRRCLVTNFHTALFTQFYRMLARLIGGFKLRRSKLVESGSYVSSLCLQ